MNQSQGPVGHAPAASGSASQYESSWQSNFPSLPVLILAIVQLVFIVLIFILEIASLGVITGFRPTGVGIWCAVPFLAASLLTIFVVRKKDGSRLWATRALIAQFVLLIFTFILIGITGNYVQNGGYNADSYANLINYALSYNSFDTKYRITQAQLAFGILLMFSGFAYVGLYVYVTYVALWKPFGTLDTDHLFRE